MGKNILADDIPPCMRLKINDKDATLPPHIPPSKQGVEPKRQKKPVIITPQVIALENICFGPGDLNRYHLRAPGHFSHFLASIFI
jgi:hypothetical protein